ncbi:hypothetical protein PACTADRAFT_45171, partial [Pachysolen tannophilus NRRL Y-2460]
EPVQLTVKFHELKTSSAEILIDLSMLPGSKEGDVAELEPLEGSSKKFYFIVKSLLDPAVVNHNNNINNNNNNNNNKQPLSTTTTTTTATNNGNVNTMNFQQKISILSGPLPLLLNLKPRSPVLIRLKQKKEIEADVVELYIRDIYLSRGDMWNLNLMLVGKCIYKSQRVTFIDNAIRGSVNGIYRNGRKVFSAYVGEDTKLVIRSESARLTFLIQISREMWNFEESGEIIFHKAINSLFPKIFKKWQELGTHHLITIVLFTSVDLGEENWKKLDHGERPRNTKDYYRVVVDQVNIVLWSEIMSSLRYEFANFMKDIIFQKNDGTDENLKDEGNKDGRFLPAIKGNILEAINLGTTLVTDHFRDPDLRHTTNHFVVITASAGLFDVDRDLMVETSKKMLSIDAALDIFCLSQPPLHAVPLFRYKGYHLETQHCIPSWVDISFWSDGNQSINQWIPRCKIYEIQMMGVMENEISDTSIENLKETKAKTILEYMDEYDEGIFKVTDDDYNSVAGYPLDDSNHRLRRSSSESSSSLDPIINTRKRQNSSPIRTNHSNDSSLSTNGKTVNTSRSHSLNLGQTASTSEKPHTNVSRDNNDRKPSDFISAKIPYPSEIPQTASSSYSNKSMNRLHTLGMTGSSPSNSLNSLSQQSKKALPEIFSEEMYAKSMMWTQIDNPSTTVDPNSVVLLVNGRWEHVFPKNAKRRAIKWTSLSSPAALPITTTHFPFDFHSNFTFKLYDIILNSSTAHEDINTGDLMREMISLRLTLGFQICVGEKVKKVERKRKPGGDANLLIKFVQHNKFEGSRIYMSYNDEVHRIAADFHGSINVQIYKRSNSTFLPVTNGPIREYYPKIRTRYDEQYTTAKIDALNNEPKKYNWNYLDQILAGYGDSIDDEYQVCNKVKFVILPAEIPENSYNFGVQDSGGANSGTQKDRLNGEEIRLEGLRRLIATLYKGRYRSPEEVRRLGNVVKKEEIIPEINFYTGNLFKFLNQQAENLDLSTANNKESLFVKENSLNLNRDIKLVQLASILQGPKGIKFVDRKWHWKTHPNCFLGLEFVSWIINNFERIDTREDAAAFGNKLMQENLFSHVESRHTFLDGHYFYKLNPEYTVDKSATALQANEGSSSITSNNNGTEIDSENRNTGWFAKRTSSENSIDSNSLIKQSSNNFQKVNSGPSNNTTSNSATDVKRVMLSRSLIYDVDPQKKSYRPELVTVHYDRVHNLEHCFHIRLEWLNTTSKLIDDTISSWSRVCERYGLKLVETPWNELCTIPTKNPFHSFVDITLAVNPWYDSEFCEGNGKIILFENKFFYHMFLLEVSGFLLDNRAALFFQDDSFEVHYSWGKSSFKYVQYIHKTGAYIAEVRDSGDLFLAPNNTHIARVNVQKNQQNSSKNENFILDSQRIMLEFRATCKDEVKLKQIFREARSRWELRRDIDDALFNDVGS